VEVTVEANPKDTVTKEKAAKDKAAKDKPAGKG